MEQVKSNSKSNFALIGESQKNDLIIADKYKLNFFLIIHPLSWAWNYHNQKYS
jgi:hypothetical protein